MTQSTVNGQINAFLERRTFLNLPLLNHVCCDSTSSGVRPSVFFLAPYRNRMLSFGAS